MLFRCLILLGFLLLGKSFAFAQLPQALQIDKQHLEFKEFLVYRVTQLAKGEQLNIHAKGVHGNFDPFVAIAPVNFDMSEARERYQKEVQEAIDSGEDTIAIISEVANEIFLSWDDDSGDGHSAHLEFLVPEAGEYLLLVFGSPARKSFGDVLLHVGRNISEVQGEEVTATGEEFLHIDSSRSFVGRSIDLIEGGQIGEYFTRNFDLHAFEAGNRLRFKVESISNELRPIARLLDYGGKPVAIGNVSGKESFAVIDHVLKERSANYTLQIERCCEGDEGGRSSGDFQIRAGLNAQIESSSAEPYGSQIFRKPIEVQVGVRIDQVTVVDQKHENFGVVADLRMEWSDPALAFNPDSCRCQFRTFSISGFEKFVSERGATWPAFKLQNLQGRRTSQTGIVVLDPDGKATYLERFAATLQAPFFDFRKFPFDSQLFFVRIDSVFPESRFVFKTLQDFSGFGSKLGEEEWLIQDYQVQIYSEQSNSVFKLLFNAWRHQNFYIFRILLPLFLIIAVSWVTFFLKDFSKRIDVTSGNLLLFIAFNFTISNDLPRLGYLTVLDILMVIAFIVSALIIMVNVYFRRLEVSQKTELARSLDRYMIWFVPVVYSLCALYIYFLVQS